MTEKKNVYVSSLSISGNSYGKPYGHLSIQANGMSIGITLSDTELSRLEQLALSFAEERKYSISEDLVHTSFKPALTYDETKTIDNGDDITF